MKQVTTRLLICAGLWLLSAAMQPASAQNSADDERLIKAAFIYNFTKFTRWPANAWQDQHAPLLLCTAGDDPLVGELMHLAGKMIKGRVLSIRPLSDRQAVENCHVLYIANSETKHYQTLVKSVLARPVLTVSEIPGFAESVGGIELFYDKDKIRFKINLAVTRTAGLDISSRLLNLAVVIEEAAP